MRRRQSSTARGYDLGETDRQVPSVPDYRRALAASHTNLGLLLKGLGQRAAAEEEYRKGLAIQEKLAADFPAVPDYRQKLAVSHNNLGVLLVDLGQNQCRRRRRSTARAWRSGEKLTAKFPSVPDYRRALAASHTNLGLLLKGLGQNQCGGGGGVPQGGLAIQEKLAADFPAVPDYPPETGRESTTTWGSCSTWISASVRRTRRRSSTARRRLAILEKLAAEFPAVPHYRHNLAESHNNLGNLLREQNQSEKAAEQYHEALAIWQKLADDFPAVPEYRQELLGSRYNPPVCLRPDARAAGRASSSARPWRSGRNWRPSSPPYPSTAMTWP